LSLLLAEERHSSALHAFVDSLTVIDANVDFLLIFLLITSRLVLFFQLFVPLLNLLSTRTVGGVVVSYLFVDALQEIVFSILVCLALRTSCREIAMTLRMLTLMNTAFSKHRRPI
jgi:hypothetical protein